MNLQKEVYTTFEVAKICNANITSIKNWISQGELRAFRTPGGHYRIERDVLDAFLKRHGMPNPFVLGQSRDVLLAHRDADLAEALAGILGSGYRYRMCADAVDALVQMGQNTPDIAVLDERVSPMDTLALCRRMRALSPLSPMTIIIAHEAGEAFDQAVREAGAHETALLSEGAEGLVAALRRASGQGEVSESAV